MTKVYIVDVLPSDGQEFIDSVWAFVSDARDRQQQLQPKHYAVRLVTREVRYKGRKSQ